MHDAGMAHDVPDPVLTLGVMGRSLKENERRLAVHPEHLAKLPEQVRSRIWLEQGYGERLGASDAELAGIVAGVRSREELVESCDVVLQPKPLLADIEMLRPGQVFWGWPHCVQDPALTQVAIDERLTLVAFEAMNHWRSDGSFGLHVFHTNNELAGYCSVLHAMQLHGVTGAYGPTLTAVVIGFGATARGAVTALTGLGVHTVDVLTHREVAAVAAPIHSARIVHFDRDPDSAGVSHAVTDEGRVPIADYLTRHDVIVNCTLQDTDAPETYLGHEDVPALKPGSLIVDVSCDTGMGFAWARPTSFDDPAFVVGDGTLYYAVDHSPSHLWKSATWENSKAIVPFIPSVLAGPDTWDDQPTIRRAVEIREGVVQNPAILSFQGRSPDYPHPRSAGD